MPDPITATVGGLFSLGAAGLGMWGAKEAGEAQQAGMDAATQAQLQMFYQQREDIAPWRETGAWALNKLRRALSYPGFLAKEVEKSPGYQFRLGEGTKAIERSGAARGMQLSGATLKGLTRFGQDYGSAETQNYLNRLFTTAGLTAQPVMAGANAAMATGGNLANIAMYGGNALANQYQNMYGIGAGAMSGIGQNIMDYMMYKKLGLFG